MKFFLIYLLISLPILGQYFSISGTVKDSLTNETLASANIYLTELNKGAISDDFGRFSLDNIEKGIYTLRISYLGYQTEIVEYNTDSKSELIINLKRTLIPVDLALIEGIYPKFRETPVAFSEINSKDIDNRLGAKTAISILEGLPSTYISQKGGGIGESRLSLRGFDHTNISVMIDGIPINNPENGEVYWSNWSGISDFLQYIHVQRGLGAIPYSTSSIGGSVNFVTLSSHSSKPNINFKTELGSENLIKNSLGFSTSLTKNIIFSGLVSRRTSDGYADQVYSDELTYFLSVGMIFNDHVVQLNLFGSPQKHGQRLTPQTIADWSNYGKRYNADWGYLNDKPLNLRDNEFHNPTLSIRHNWQLTNNLMWTNLLSLSHGSGGGTVPPWYPELQRTPDGLINFDREWQINSNNIDSDFHPSLNKSIIALRKGIHKNYWGTFISSLKYNFDDFTFNFGVDGKLYSAENYNEINNLLGGDYTVWSNNVNQDPSALLTVGDKVDFYADSFTRNIGSFIQTEYNHKNLTAYINFTIATTGYNRIDYFNYLENDPNRETGWKYFTGKNIKAGLNYNLDAFNNLYLNAGNFSRAPLSMNVYDYSNNLYENVKNEKIFSFEVGYGLKNSFSNLTINYFNTIWDNKAFSGSFLNSDSTAIYYYNLFGASAKHTGIEIEGKLSLTEKLILGGMFSYSKNKWTNDVDAYVRPESNPTDEIKYHAYTDGLYVGNYPMTTGSLYFLFSEKFHNDIIFYFNPVWNYYGRYYADFNPESRVYLKDKNVQPWKIPIYYNFDIHTGLDIKKEFLFIKTVKLSFNIFNIMNDEYIIEATDGLNHNSESAEVWYGRERWWSASLSIGF